MKKSVLFGAAAALLIASAADAQVSNMQIGVDAGVSMAKFVGDDVEGGDWRTAPYFGGSLVFHRPGSAIGFQTGLLYVGKGGQETEDDLTFKLKVDYVEVPLMLRVGIPMAGAQPVLTVGGSVAFKSRCRVELSGGGASISADCDEADEEEFDIKSFDFGVTGGLEIGIPITPSWVLTPQVRYTRGLVDVFEDVSVKNSAFQFGAALRFRM